MFFSRLLEGKSKSSALQVGSLFQRSDLLVLWPPTNPGAGSVLLLWTLDFHTWSQHGNLRFSMGFHGCSMGFHGVSKVFNCFHGFF